MENFPNLIGLFLCVTSILVNSNDHFSGLPRMEALVRIANIPLVETGVKTAGKVYYSLKVSVLCQQLSILSFIHGYHNSNTKNSHKITHNDI